jgi:PmbA protein
MNNEDLKDTYLEAIYFSNLQVDPLTGYFGGEIRLAILHKDGKEIPVTGCSISGNLVESQKYIKLSNTIQSFDNYIGPDKIFFKNISVSGN